MAYCYFAADCLPCFKCLVIFLWKKQPNTEKSEEAHAEGEAGHEESEKEEGSLNLTSKQLVEYGVKLEQVGRGEVEQNLSYPAKLVVNTDQQAHVSSTFSARVDSVNVALGQQVEKGQALATLFVPDLVDQQANLSMAQEALTLAQQDYQRENNCGNKGFQHVKITSALTMLIVRRRFKCRLQIAVYLHWEQIAQVKVDMF